MSIKGTAAIVLQNLPLLTEVALRGQCDLVSIMVPKGVKKKVSLEETKILEDFKIWLIFNVMDLENTESSVREGVRCQYHTYTSSPSLCIFLKKFSLILSLNALILLVDFKSDARLFHILALRKMILCSLSLTGKGHVM